VYLGRFAEKTVDTIFAILHSRSVCQHTYTPIFYHNLSFERYKTYSS